MNATCVVESRVRAAALAAALAVAAGAVHGTPLNEPALSVWTRMSIAFASAPFEDHDQDRQYVQGAHASALRSSLRLEALPVASANARAHAGFGVVGTSVDAHGLQNALWRDLPHSGVGGIAEAGAGFFDVLTIQAPGVSAGTRGTLWVSLELSGNWGGGFSGPLIGPQTAFSGWGLSVATEAYVNDELLLLGRSYANGEFYQADGEQGAEAYSGHQIGKEAPVEDSSFDSATVPTLWSQLPIFFGVPIGLGFDIGVWASAGIDSSALDPDDPASLHTYGADAHSSFAHTLRWGGVQKILDANGREVEGWTITSATGTNYAVAVVPEPATWLALLSGLVALALWRSRSSR